MKCHECKFLKVISIPDWFKCDYPKYEASTQTELNKKCPINTHKEVSDIQDMIETIEEIQQELINKRDVLVRSGARRYEQLEVIKEHLESEGLK